MPTETSDSKTLIAIGKIGRSYGVRGAFHAWSYTQPESNILDYLPWQFNNANQETIIVHKAKMMGKKIIAQSKSYTTPESIKTIVNQALYIPKERLPKLPEGEHYWHDLKNIAVYDQDKQKLGTIAYIMDAPANPVIVIRQDDTKKQLLLPYIDEVVNAVDTQMQTMHVTWHGYEEEDED
jgi:16S rRNA processing protein RimM